MGHPVLSELAAPCVICPRGCDDLHFVPQVDEVIPVPQGEVDLSSTRCLPVCRLKGVQDVGSE